MNVLVMVPDEQIIMCLYCIEFHDVILKISELRRKFQCKVVCNDTDICFVR